MPESSRKTETRNEKNKAERERDDKSDFTSPKALSVEAHRDESWHAALDRPSRRLLARTCRSAGVPSAQSRTREENPTDSRVPSNGGRERHERE